MAMSDATPSGFDWGVGSAIGTTFSTLFANFVSFVGLALLMGLPGLFLGIGGLDDANFVKIIVNFVMGQVVTITLIYGTVQSLRGRPAGIAECLSQGFSRLPAAIGVAILSGLGIVIGLFLLIVPGFFLATMWAVAIPVAVIESAGVGASFSRSASLTQGRRWRVFGALVVAWIVTIGIGATIGVAMGGALGVAADTPMLVLLWAVGAVTQAFISTLSGVLYYFLRRDKEGADIESIAAVFD